MKVYPKILFLMLYTLVGRAQEKVPYVPPRFEGKFRVDVVPDQSGWRAIPTLPTSMHLLTPFLARSPARYI